MSYRLYLSNSCGAFDFKDNIIVNDYDPVTKVKGNAIIITFNKKRLIIPLSSIACIEELE